MEFRILGPPEVVEGNRAVPISSPRQRALLCLLIANAGRVVSSERILDELWGDEPPESGRQTVAYHVAQLRRSLPCPAPADGPIETSDGGYRLAVPPETIDAVRFERLAAEGHAGLVADPAAATERLAAALGLWRGEPYEGLDELPFAAAEIRRLGELRLRATEDHLEAELALGQGAGLVPELTTLVDREPLRERLRALLIVALYRSGRQADALRVYGEGRRVLAEELGIDPGPELAALETAILRQDTALLTGPLPPVGGPGGAVAGAPAGPARNPYKGLRPFDEADAADFFGREALTARLVTRLGEVARASGFLAVVGPSGSGKSSVVRAGLLPALRAGGLPGSGRWRIALLFPGARPFEELAAAMRAIAVDPEAVPTAETLAGDPAALAASLAGLAPADGRLVLVIDQLEELWTLADEEAQTDFLGSLTTALASPGSRLLVVAALRVDHLEGALRSSALGPLARDGTELVPPLNHDELGRAIERPAIGAGLGLEPGLAATIVADVADHPAMRPPLQYTLTELAEEAVARRLTRAGYAAIGGVVGALASRAEATYAALEPEGREAARQAFLRLVAVEPTGEASARRVAQSELGDAGSVTDVLGRFAAARLLAFGRDARTGSPTIELAHEALLARWPRLAGWVDTERDALWMRRRLGDAADEWQEHDRDRGFLLTGGRLELFETWAAATDLALGVGEQALLEASVAERRRVADVEAARAAKEARLERRGTRMLRALVAVFAVAAVVASGLLVAVWRQSELAAEERAVAAARELAVASGGRLAVDPTLALLLAVEAARATADRGWITEEAMDALHWAIQDARIPYPTEEVPTAVRLGPDGPRGVWLLPADKLMELAATGAGRTLTAEECRTYLHREPCPTPLDPADPGAGLPGGLAVLIDAGPVPMAELASPSGGIAGTGVRVHSQLPADLPAALTDFAASGVAVSITEGRGAVAPADLVGPDIAILARPGDVTELARAGGLIDLAAMLTTEEAAALADLPLADLGWVGTRAVGPDAIEGRLVGVPLAVTASSLLWYPRDAFAAAGYEPPATWVELEALAEAMLADGRTPWCLGFRGGEADGEADGSSGADLLEDLVLDTIGGQQFDAWAEGATPFDLHGVEMAYRRFHDLLHGDGLVLRGAGSAVRTPNTWVATQMGIAAEPACWLVHASAEARTRWEGPVREDLTPIRLPVGDPGAGDLRGRAYTLVVIRDRPEVRALVRTILDASFAERLVRDDLADGILPLARLGRGDGPATLESETAALADAAVRAGAFRADATDRMPREIGAAAVPDSILRVVETSPSSSRQAIALELEQIERLRVTLPR